MTITTVSSITYRKFSSCVSFCLHTSNFVTTVVNSSGSYVCDSHQLVVNWIFNQWNIYIYIKTLKIPCYLEALYRTSYLLLRSTETSIAEVTKVIIKARILTRTYILKKKWSCFMVDLWELYVLNVILRTKKDCYYIFWVVVQSSSAAQLQLN